MKSKFKLLQLSLALLLTLAMIAPLWAAARIEKVDSRFACTAGEAVTETQIVMMKSDGKCYLADANDATLRPAIGVAGSRAALGAAFAVVTRGQVGGLTGLTKGAHVYLSETAGAITQSEPTWSDNVGVAISATQYVVDIFGHGQVATPNAGTITTGMLTDANVTSTKASTPLITRSVTVTVPDPGAANADLSAGYVLWTPSVNVTITKIRMIPETAWVAAASTNDASVVVTNASVGALATLSVVTALAAGSSNDMGTITNANVVAGTNVTLAITTNGTADSPRNSFQIDYITAD